MNIKEHIEAGHYPTDEKGRALVRIGDLGEEGWTGGLATVLATDGNVGEEIIARFPCARACHWAAGGRKSFPTATKTERAYVLLPPPPRKVEVVRWIIMAPGDTGKSCGTWKTREGAVDWLDRLGYPWSDKYELVELTGEFEESWS